MALFGKNGEEDYEDEDELLADEEKEDRRFTRNFKDLKPENRRKRKEPPKPWGKKERLLVLIFLLVTVVVSAVLALSATSRSFSGFHINLSKPDFSFLNIFKEETIEIRKK
jgi:hypothetical protein